MVQRSPTIAIDRAIRHNVSLVCNGANYLKQGFKSFKEDKAKKLKHCY
jgi:hypothetical protein